jgi:hypothetical protein
MKIHGCSVSQEETAFANLLRVIFFFGTVVVALQIPARCQDGVPQIDEPKSQTNEPAGRNRKDLHWLVDPAVASSDPLRYRFWPLRENLKPNSALVHFTRALAFYSQVDPRLVKGFEDYLETFSTHDHNPTDLARHIAGFAQVLNELDSMAQCEDLHWGASSRNLGGRTLFSDVRFPEQGVTWKLANLIKFRALVELDQRRFDDAIASVRCGYRLIAFLRQGGLLEHHLTANFIELAMLDVIEKAIQTPGCPNLYWAIATLPDEYDAMLRTIEDELMSYKRRHPLLIEPEAVDWSPENWKENWKEFVTDCDSYWPTPLQGQFLKASEDALKSDAKHARKRLLAMGLNTQTVAAMCSEQALAVDIAYEIRRENEEMLTALYTPYPSNLQLLEKRDRENMQRMEALVFLWFDPELQKEPLDPLLKPLLESRRKDWESRLRDFVPRTYKFISDEYQRYLHAVQRKNYLLTIEAIRHFAGAQKGRFPESLSALTELLPNRDSLNGEWVAYEVKKDDDGPFAEFRVYPTEIRSLLNIMKSPNSPPPHPLRLRLRK